MWDINVQCDNVIESRRPDIIIIVNKERKAIIIQSAVPKKKKKKVKKYQELKRNGKIAETQNGSNCACHNRSPCKCHKKLSYCHMQRWSDAKGCIVGSCKDIKESVTNVKKRSFC